MSSDNSPTEVSSELPNASQSLQQGNVVEIEITDISESGEGVGRVGNQVVFVPDTVTGDVITARLVTVKRQYAHGKLLDIITPSPHRVRPSCIVADKCGGCQLQHIDYDYQLTAKENQVIQALKRIGGFAEPPVAPIVGAQGNFAYRNKVTYPLGVSDSGGIKAGYYRKGTHQIVNLNQCPVQDERLNPLLAEIKQDIQDRGWQIYQPESKGAREPGARRTGVQIIVSQYEDTGTTERGISKPKLRNRPMVTEVTTVPDNSPKFRHLLLRIGRRTGEILLTLVVTDFNIPDIEGQAQRWMQRYPNLVGVCLNLNDRPNNTIFGSETRCIAGREYICETFGHLQFQLKADTFFQIYTEQAEAVLNLIIDRAGFKGTETLIDAYCGIGTFTLPLSKRVKRVVGIEVHSSSVVQARANARLNGINNIEFRTGEVEELLPAMDIQADVILLDPPRTGCDRAVLDALTAMQPAQIIYISCKPATLARDLQILCEQGGYQLTYVQPADFFPQTAHVECVAFLTRAEVAAPAVV
ncbi:23S rRNA (uracil(1939)-C(5))-methyltransferase RlmD [Chamaesiphon sp. OTE_20_metabat_361]|uniref:23S rRNA (uracil(1939)-C(5))-methyltransferase RlmD n=1 Tax=Chamaesiphon sp. OTE_20_metabat_361 TaxID=2964689 RepID=UPI00286D2659|nr:23S rRNA (uracil(1939)-C(5))-methyltransferase RlmD [Chamaesiphon sp. OTE_20_metabat_361]